MSFTLDGNLVGDIGEALAVELFGIPLVKAKSTEGIDGCAPNGKTVQVKATGTGRGPGLRCVETKADYLVFFDLDLQMGAGHVIFEGLEDYASAQLHDLFPRHRALSPNQIRNADQLAQAGERLTRLDTNLRQAT